MNRITFSNAVEARFPVATKTVLSCSQDRASEIYGIIESLMNQTGLRPDSDLSLGLLRRGLGLGLYRVVLSDSSLGTNTEETDPDAKNQKTDTEAAEEQPAAFDQTPNLFGGNF